MMAEREQDSEHISIVNLTRNFGLEGAINAALRVAAGDAVVIMDADMQDSPQIIPQFIQEWENGAEIVVGVRTERKHDSWFKRKSASLFYRIFASSGSKVEIARGAGNFRLLSRRALRELLSLPESKTILRVSTPYIGMKTTYINYARGARESGSTKYSLRAMTDFALETLAANSVAPLRVTRIFPAAAALLFLISLIFAFLFSTVLQGVFIICALVLFLFIPVFLCIALFAEYLAQIFLEVKRRPISIVDQYLPSRNAQRSERFK
jgi:dolichol-phosphate mannosyltransferase